ncbi:MAG: hypothetical protein MJZ00_03460 [Paludibacteraceae bacterium]|nr:hypothetical protein [Paludibacteraceae bacterium]
MSETTYKKIKEIAETANGNQLTRADLAYELKIQDSVEVARLTWEAYNFYNNNQLIKSIFINNDSNSSLVDDYELRQLIASGKNDEYFTALSTDLKIGEKALSILDEMLKTKVAEVSTSQMSDFLSSIAGTRGIQNVKNEAGQAVQLYGRLVNVYDEAKDGVKEVAHDFVDLRVEIQRIYEKYAQMLVDFYGDSIKRVAPSLFDFDSIEYLDTAKMFESIKLQYDQLSENCTVMMSEISDSFANSVRIASQGGNKMGRNAALALAAVEAVKHYLDASEKTVRMKGDLEAFKMNVKKDVVNIKTDYTRLLTIYRTINDLYIPKANAYFRFSDKLLSREFQQMISTLYSKAGVAELVTERDKVMSEIRAISDEFNDHRNNIAFYEEHITSCYSVLNHKKDDYESAKKLRPSKPFFLVKLLTFGIAEKNYNEKIYKWNSIYGNVVKEYENAEMDINADVVELDSHVKAKKDKEQKLMALKAKQQDLTEKILETISVDSEMKKTLASHIEDIVRMLYVGKTILESGLEKCFACPSTIEEYSSNELPAEVKKAVAEFRKMVDDAVSTVKEDVAKEYAKDYNEQESAELTTKTSYAIDESMRLADSVMSLMRMRESNQLTSEVYDKELEKLKQEFDTKMKEIDSQADVLGEVLKNINTAGDADTLKKAFVELAKGSKVFATEDDVVKFLKGELKITI